MPSTAVEPIESSLGDQLAAEIAAKLDTVGIDLAVEDTGRIENHLVRVELACEVSGNQTAFRQRPAYLPLPCLQ